MAKLALELWGDERIDKVNLKGTSQWGFWWQLCYFREFSVCGYCFLVRIIFFLIFSPWDVGIIFLSLWLIFFQFPSLTLRLTTALRHQPWVQTGPAPPTTLLPTKTLQGKTHSKQKLLIDETLLACSHNAPYFWKCLRFSSPSFSIKKNHQPPKYLGRQ
jgi:hypothetical protein